ncbi:hypothetical protein [Hymenobacter edaphi]|nr:hypothetical protein [Hymenobacter edaphi]
MANDECCSGRLAEEVRQPDADVKAFKLLNRALFDDCQQARKLVTTSG